MKLLEHSCKSETALIRLMDGRWFIWESIEQENCSTELLQLIQKNFLHCCYCHCFVLTCLCHHPPHSQRTDKNPLSWRNDQSESFFKRCQHIIATQPSTNKKPDTSMIQILSSLFLLILHSAPLSPPNHSSVVFSGDIPPLLCCRLAVTHFHFKLPCVALTDITLWQLRPIITPTTASVSVHNLSHHPACPD